MLWHALDKLFLIVTFGSTDQFFYFCAAVYTPYVHVCQWTSNTNVLLVNLSTSESMTTMKNETFNLNYIAFTNIISGMEMTTLAIVISNYESLDLLS